jgi:hypothetical protein
LEPGAQAVLTVPIQVHLHGETDPYGAESGVWVNGEGGWVNGFDMGDRRWYRHVIPFVVPPSGQAQVVIRVKSKWPNPKDFFFDGITLVAQTAVPPFTPPTPPVGEDEVVYVLVPAGRQLVVGKGRGNAIEVNVPAGMKVEQIYGGDSLDG